MKNKNKPIHPRLRAEAEHFAMLVATAAVAALKDEGDASAQKARQHLIRKETWLEAAALVKRLEGL